MRIKRILISRYGPISDIDLKPKPGLQVIYGRNEAGKTLSIDAMIKMMVGDKDRDFKDIDRVSESPEGFILFEDRDAGEIKVDFKDPLVKNFPTESLDLRNILIIRNSDLKLFDQDQYLKEVTDRLTGLQTERIELIIKKLAAFGRLTNPSSSATLSKKQEYYKVDQVRSDAVALRKQFKDYISIARKQGYDELELRSLESKDRALSLKNIISMMEKSFELKNYKKNKEIISRLKEDLEEFIKLQGFDDATRDKIGDLSRSIELKEESLKELKRLARGLEEKIEKDRKSLGDLEGRLKALDNKKVQVEALKKQLEGLRSPRAESLNRKSRVTVLAISVLSLVFSGTGFYILLTMGYPVLYLSIPIIFFISFLIFLIMFFIGSRREEALRLEKIKILDSINLMGIKASDLKEVQNGIAAFDDEYQETKDKRDRAANTLEVDKMSHGEARSNIKRMSQDILDAKARLKSHLDALMVKDIEGFEKSYRERNSLHNDIISSCKTLSKDTYLGISEISEKDLEGLKSHLDSWEEAIERNRPKDIDEENLDYKDFSKKDIEEKTEVLEKVGSEKLKMDNLLREHDEKLSSFDSSFKLLKLEDFLEQDIDIRLSNIERLEEAVEILDRFIKKIDKEFDIAIRSIKIFEDIRAEEDLKIGDLFNDLKVSQYFKRISSGRYDSVFFDSEKMSIKVVDTEGKELEATDLSKGTMDQLYLSVRLSLSEKLFMESPGFFVFDDPLLASDKERTKNQFDILKEFCDNGWSILYFTVKDEISDIAAGYSKNKVIML